jgi:hypothetical protein
MKDKYKKYIDYIAKDIEAPYIKSLNMYGLKDNEYELVLNKVFNQQVIIEGRDVYNTNGNEIYYETINGYWYKHVYNTNGKIIYHEDSYGNWYKREYDTNDNLIYIETSTGEIRDNR